MLDHSKWIELQESHHKFPLSPSLNISASAKRGRLEGVTLRSDYGTIQRRSVVEGGLDNPSKAC